MTAGRVIGETFSVEAALAPAGSVLGDVLATWDVGEPDGDGLIDLGLWLSYTCATAETSARTGAATALSGFAANAARGYSFDGTTWGLLLEPATTNLLDEQDLTNWTPNGTPQINSATTPTGTTEDVEVEDDDGAGIESIAYSITPGAVAEAHTLSAWHLLTAPTPTSGSPLEYLDGEDEPTINVTAIDAAWDYDTAAASAIGDGDFQITPRATTAADIGATRWWGIQLEQHAYPTSFMGADNATFSRAAGTLAALSAELTDSGYFDLELVLSPLFASDETAVDAVLFWVDSDNFAIYRESDGHVVLVLDGVDVAESAALTFAAGDELTIRLQHRPDRAAVTVTGAAAGDGEVVEDAEPPVTFPTSVGICSGASGVTEGLALHTITAYQPTDTLRLPGWMRLDDGLPVGVDGLTINVGARVAIAAEGVAPDGLLRVTMVWRPVHDDSVDDMLLDLGDATLVFDTTAAAIVWTIDDGVVAAQSLQSSAVSFSAGDTIEVEIEHNDNRRRITVDGVVATGDPLPALVLPSEGYVLSDSDGSVYGGELVSFRPHLTTFAELVDESCLVQMGDNFRAWVQAMVQDKARTFDALLGIRAAFDKDQAVGTQLDTIGSIVGLAREGFTDARYEVFLNIQIDLLLSAAREDNNWVGTPENLISITRTFLGVSFDPIVFRAAPPYCWAMTVEELIYSEATLLMRFLTTATHAGVRGLMAVALEHDQLWASDSVVVHEEGTWGSDSVVVAGAMTWGTVLCSC